MNVLKQKKHQPLSAFQIMEVVSESTKVCIEDMQSDMQHREIVEARYITMKLIVDNLMWLSFKEVAELFNRTASIVSYAIRQCNDWYEVDFVYAEKYKQAEEAVNQFIFFKQP